MKTQMDGVDQIEQALETLLVADATVGLWDFSTDDNSPIVGKLTATDGREFYSVDEHVFCAEDVVVVEQNNPRTVSGQKWDAVIVINREE